MATSTLLKLSIVSVLLSSWLITAQDTPNIPGLPACAQPCATDALKASGCSVSDAVCQCKDTTSGGLGFVNGIDRCAAFGCSSSDQLTTYNVVHAYCNNALGTA